MTRERYDELCAMTMADLLEPHVCTMEEFDFLLENNGVPTDEIEFDKNDE